MSITNVQALVDGIIPATGYKGSPGQTKLNTALSALVNLAGVKVVSATEAHALAVDTGLLLCDSTGGAFTVTLPAAADAAGRTVTFVVTAGANIVTLEGAGAETINGAATFTALDAVNDAVTLVSTGTAWFVISENIA